MGMHVYNGNTTPTWSLRREKRTPGETPFRPVFEESKTRYSPLYIWCPARNSDGPACIFRSPADGRRGIAWLLLIIWLRNGMAAAGAPEEVVVKLVMGDELRRTRARLGAFSYGDLLAAAGAAAAGGRARVTYRDGEGDTIVVANDADVTEGLRVAIAGKCALRLDVVFIVAAAAAAPLVAMPAAASTNVSMASPAAAPAAAPRSPEVGTTLVAVAAPPEPAAAASAADDHRDMYAPIGAAAAGLPPLAICGAAAGARGAPPAYRGPEIAPPRGRCGVAIDDFVAPPACPPAAPPRSPAAAAGGGPRVRCGLTIADFQPALAPLGPRLRSSATLRAGLDAAASLPGAGALAARLGALAAAGAHPNEALQAALEWRGLPDALAAVLAADPTLVLTALPVRARAGCPVCVAARGSPRASVRAWSAEIGTACSRLPVRVRAQAAGAALARAGIDPQALVTASEARPKPVGSALPPFDLPALLSFVAVAGRRAIAAYAGDAGRAAVPEADPSGGGEKAAARVACEMCTLLNERGAVVCAACAHALGGGGGARAGAEAGEAPGVTREGVTHVRPALRRGHRAVLAFACANCGVAPIRGPRFVCAACPYAALCSTCWHERAHACPMERVAPLTEGEITAFAAAAAPPRR